MSTTALTCRPGCGACCTAPSISSPIPGMPEGKPAGVRCLQLDEDERCRLFHDPRRPAVCSSLAPRAALCGPERVHALRWLPALEAATTPAGGPAAPRRVGAGASAAPWPAAQRASSRSSMPVRSAPPTKKKGADGENDASTLKVNQAKPGGGETA